MKFPDLLTIFRIIINNPELIRYTSENEISGAVGDRFFRIEICCGGSGTILTLADNSKVDFDLDGDNRETFDTLFAAAREQSKKYNYNKLLEELNRYESSRDSFDNNQPLEADAISFEHLL